MYKRIHVIVLDSVGVGALPDANLFGDAGSDTLGHISECTDLALPNLEQMGLGNIRDLRTVKKVALNNGYAAKLEEQSNGKDTMNGHWELMGLITHTPFPVYPDGFSADLLAKIEEFSGRKVVCNLPYSGTAVIDDYGPEQMETGALIVYTSADPVLQIAAHEEIIPLEELYRICKYVRSITLEQPHVVGRIIARPYVGQPGSFQRTAHRHDYALSPFDKTVLDYLKENGNDVIAIGKINDIFNGQGITRAIPTKSNMDGVDQLLSVLGEDFTGLSFVNLVDFDAMYGHRRNPTGYAKALEDFDRRVPELLHAMKESDLLLITADHGNDPTYAGTDHTREYVPLLAWSPGMQSGGLLEQGLFADIAATISENFRVPSTGAGKSFLSELK